MRGRGEVRGGAIHVQRQRDRVPIYFAKPNLRKKTTWAQRGVILTVPREKEVLWEYAVGRGKEGESGRRER